MNEQNLTVGIDEVTIVLMPKNPVTKKYWLGIVNDMLSDVIKKLELEPLYDSIAPMENKIPQGYTNALTIPNRPWYFAMAWNENHYHMGVCIKFSAYALASYITQYEIKFKKKISIIDILQNLQDESYITRLSRIDFTADYKNFDTAFSPDTIYNRLLTEQYTIKNHNGRTSSKKTSAVSKNGKVSTFYAGARSKNVYSFLRCYDKRTEQIETNGFRLDEALACKSWTRFEICYRGKYAHQITEDLLFLNSANQLQKYISQKITEKYRFFDNISDSYTDFTSMLLDVIDDSNFSYLRNESPRDNELRKSIQHLISGSGLFPTFYKTYGVWDVAGEEKLFDFLLEYYQTVYKPNASKNKELKLWLKIHQKELECQSLDDILSEIQIEKKGV